MAKTKIEWCDYSINCFWGCTKGCSYCMARSIARRFGRYLGIGRHYDQDVIERMANFEPIFLYDQLWQIAKIKTPSKIFMSFMGEPFEFPETDLQMAFDTMRQYPQHTFIMLTKRPENLAKWNFPPNCWVGVSATNWLQFSDALGYLIGVQASVKFLSLEPLLEHIQLDMMQKMIFPSAVDWLIIGQRTPASPKTAPKIEWIREIVEAANKAGIPIFLKDNLLRLVTSADSWALAFKGGGLRQEFPKV